MTLLARMARLEASRPPTQVATIIASDQEDYETQLEGLLLRSRPGPQEVSGAIGGRAFNLTGVLKSHEEMLGELV
ncbi:hypothetical protein [Aminobacter niigataensis]|uniref:hypothetical protein n=1 Tax=Aminobacter niigataensis TaxID=83265 RepID=UPI0024C61D22|nr:hypothetical protein [Aminobacter niigataensis]CAI2932450.1 protein of unknown function [Aminobacter niigataensis]